MNEQARAPNSNWEGGNHAKPTQLPLPLPPPPFPTSPVFSPTGLGGNPPCEKEGEFLSPIVDGRQMKSRERQNFPTKQSQPFWPFRPLVFLWSSVPWPNWRRQTRDGPAPGKNPGQTASTTNPTLWSMTKPGPSNLGGRARQEVRHLGKETPAKQKQQTKYHFFFFLRPRPAGGGASPPPPTTPPPMGRTHILYRQQAQQAPPGCRPPIGRGPAKRFQILDDWRPDPAESNYSKN